MDITNLPNGWHIEYNPKPIPDRRHDYDFWHDDYDGADGGNGLAGTAVNKEDVLEQIREIDKEGLRDAISISTIPHTR